MTITPIGERVLIKPEKAEEQTKSGIYIPETAQEKKKEGTVISVGTRDDGTVLPIKPGDHVIYGGYSADKFERDSEDYVFVPFKDILAKIE
ncbi:chaperonin GroES [Methanomicrobium sp. W14]|jgi:chaperonin GroES|uniref:co-chaperone GroES n=1 Tax=Methanomicrobium sp. W14 TaxID=2817839 RepID=UPI001AE626D3|nr:co-chaperone GroES [Methanomicrobium sp. W14]MBP2134553.1 chaperonin GroES [Methanomicrobium sp. W14]